MGYHTIKYMDKNPTMKRKEKPKGGIINTPLKWSLAKWISERGISVMAIETYPSYRG